MCNLLADDIIAKHRQYTYYELPDFSNFSNYLSQAKPLLEEVTILKQLTILSSLKEKAEASYHKQTEIADHYEQQIQVLNQEITELKNKINELESENSTITNQAKDSVEKLVEKAALELAQSEQKAKEAIEELTKANQEIQNLKEEIKLVFTQPIGSF